MSGGEFILALGGFLVTGLVSSLHCIGMCGPLLVGFSQSFQLTVQGRRVDEPTGESRGLLRIVQSPFVCYHLGRIWTYALLGMLAGIAGTGLRHGSALVGWQRAAGVSLGVLVILTGAVLLGFTPQLKLPGCAAARRAIEPLLGGRGATPRLLLGAIMGLLPCGLVYAMLTVAAAMPTPWHAAAAMIAFGIGTLPALTAVLIASNSIPLSWRLHGSRVAAVMVIATGSWMIARTLLRQDCCQPSATPFNNTSEDTSGGATMPHEGTHEIGSAANRSPLARLRPPQSPREEGPFPS